MKKVKENLNLSSEEELAEPAEGDAP